MYSVENGLVHSTFISSGGAEVKMCVGNVRQYKTTITDTQIICQWQEFNLDVGCYVDDVTNDTQIQGITPTNGQVVLPLPASQEPVDEEKAAMAEAIIDLNNRLTALESA